MIIVGTKGFAKEVLQILYQKNKLDNIIFFDNISQNLPDKLYNKYRILKNYKDAEEYINTTDNRFTLGLGHPKIRAHLTQKFKSYSGKLTSVISPKADIGAFNTCIGQGVNIMTGAVITNDVIISDGCLINLNCTIGHGSILGEFTEISPGVHISGNCQIGKFCSIGTGAVVLPEIKIGDRVNIGAGSVVTKNIGDNQTVVGVPARSTNK